ncbi:hypothetical protein [Herpetosiphon giganteus]|uniref:hypothetical protein n=1 Tax=Herpetosiphon giganteus TaxID=2029754 RepID=UPI0019585580|nr:hypothetical protein [Herpetosiphon giganteus]MBM7844362.1 hypothetical protein [Herpetosiphon giganteus]
MKRRTFLQATIAGIAAVIIPNQTHGSTFTQSKDIHQVAIPSALDCEQWLLQTMPQQFASITDILANPTGSYKNKKP